jgi:(1->4)-alpha-D-glucan 1-alpha-D-glucosylmutase
VGHPTATYRLQLGPDLDFAAAAGLVGYLADLGVSHLYLSPLLAARAGSTHGYDVADPRQVSAALGGEEGLRALAAAAAERGMGLVADIVPNHLGTGPDNPLWEALLAEGPAGEAGSVFDVDWHHPLPGAEGKVILPVLGAQYGDALHKGELWVADEGEPRLRYHEHSFPLSLESREALERSATLGSLWGEPGQPESWARLHGLLEAQHYRLVHRRSGRALINYRRFFAIDELAAVRVEDPEVFDLVHGKVLDLVADGVLEGLRVDHPDGLRDPSRYLARLAERSGGVWTVVEKILEEDEQLPGWPVAGTTGYDFANDVLGLFVDPAAEAGLDSLDAAFDTPARGYEERAIEAKQEVLHADLHADLRRLARRLWVLTQQHPEVRDVDDLACTDVLARVLAAMDVYRAYVDPETGAASDADRAIVRRAVERARGTGPDELYGFVERLLCGEAGQDAAHLDVVGRFQQLSGAVMAKGVEDTAFYRHQRLVALNEVGGNPMRLGTTVESFHRRNALRADRHPTGMLTTATHDTKRGEDVRLRIAALSELADRWSDRARSWHEAHSGPDPQTALLAFQTMIGLGPSRDAGRLHAYLVKASREAGLRTSWTDPDAGFEDTLGDWVDGLLADEGLVAELDALAADANEIAMVASLAQTLLRATSPGVPDTYQGTELWEDNLVDPDNRRPVDFTRRAELLAQLDAGTDPAALWDARHDGRVKLWVLSRALRARRVHPDAAFGAYQPLAVSGRWADHLVAYARTGGGQTLVTLAPRLPGAVMGPELRPPLGEAWGDTTVALPAGGPWRDALSGRGHPSGDAVAAADALAVLPVVLLMSGAT